MSANIESKKSPGMTNDQLYQLSTLLGSFALLIDAAVMMWTGVFDDMIYVGLMLGLVCITVSFWQYIGANGDSKDERTLKVSTYAITLSWFTSLMIIGYTALIVFYEHVAFNTVQAIGYVLFIIVGTMLVCLAYYNRKGDVEIP